MFTSNNLVSLSFKKLATKAAGIFVMLLIAACPSLFAQKKNSVGVDSFQYYVRYVQSAEELMPLPEDHPEYKEPQAELTLVLYLNSPEKMKAVNVDLGNQKGLGDIRKWKFDIIKIEDKIFLQKGDKQYPIIEGKAVITETVPADIYTKKMHLEVETQDNAGKKSEKKHKELH